MAAGSGDRIEIRGLRVLGVHGVLAEERERPQPFELDLDISADLGPGADRDDLGATVDYGVLAARAAGVVRERSFALLEALGAAVADEVLAVDPRLEAVAVTVRKLRPPLPLDVGSVGVRVARRRSG